MSIRFRSFLRKRPLSSSATLNTRPMNSCRSLTLRFRTSTSLCSYFFFLPWWLTLLPSSIVDRSMPVRNLVYVGSFSSAANCSSSSSSTLELALDRPELDLAKISSIPQLSAFMSVLLLRLMLRLPEPNSLPCCTYIYNYIYPLAMSHLMSHLETLKYCIRTRNRVKDDIISLFKYLNMKKLMDRGERKQIP